jgi:RNA methyltransferase, TrmH family
MITSTQNSSFKFWQKLKTKKYRDLYDQFLVYGPHLIAVAQKYKAIVEIITTDPNIEGTLVSEALMNELKQTETGFNIMAVCKKVNHQQSSTHILALDDIQDPDNVGALIRSAAAFGFNHVIFSLKTADLYNEKVIRASKGSIFDVYVERKPLVEALKDLQQQGYQVYYADAHAPHMRKKNDKIVLVMGNEGHGISEEIKDIADGSITIPTQKVESLNVSVAGGIIMYEWRNL